MSVETRPLSFLNANLSPGEIVGGKYRVDELLAEGGMAAVWAGHHERTGKRVALKVLLRPFAAHPDIEELFRNEGLAAGRVNHPNIVSVFDVIDISGRTCLVMEFLEGETLASFLSRVGPLRLDDALVLLLPAMRGVAAANSQGVVHRDLKPGNIFLCVGPDGRFVTSKVLDFGIAIILETLERAVEPSAASSLFFKFGTPSYMSPEHIAAAGTTDIRTDVYGFGVLLFEALTGRVPFSGEPGPALFSRIIEEPAPKMSDIRDDLPADAVSIVDRALAKEPEQRFPDLDHMIRALEDHLLPFSSQPSVSLRPLSAIGGAAAARVGEQKARKNRAARVWASLRMKVVAGPAAGAGRASQSPSRGTGKIAAAVVGACVLSALACWAVLRRSGPELPAGATPAPVPAQIVPGAIATPSPFRLPASETAVREATRPSEREAAAKAQTPPSRPEEASARPALSPKDPEGSVRSTDVLPVQLPALAAEGAAGSAAVSRTVDESPRAAPESAKRSKRSRNPGLSRRAGSLSASDF